MLEHQNQHFVRGFLQFWHVDTVKKENQKHETRHVGASKRAFHARCPPSLTRWHDQKERFYMWPCSFEFGNAWTKKKKQKCPGGDGGPHFGDPNLTLGSQTSTESGTYQTCSHMFPLHYRGTQPHVSCCTFVIIKPCSLYKVENLSWAYMRAEWVLGINQGPRNTRGLLWKNLGLSQKP